MNKRILIGLLVAGIILGIIVHFYNQARYASHARTFIQTPAEEKTESIEQISHPQDGAKKQEVVQEKKDHAHDQQLIKELTDKIKASPQEATYYYQRAIANYSMQQYQSSIDDLTEVIKLVPDSANAYYFRGLNYAARLDYKNAITDYSAALRIKHNDPIILNSRALAEVEMGDTQAAWEDYSLALRQQPEYDHAHYNLGTLYERQKKYAEAKAEYDLAIKYYKPDSKTTKQAEEAPVAPAAPAASTGTPATVTDATPATTPTRPATAPATAATSVSAAANAPAAGATAPTTTPAAAQESMDMPILVDQRADLLRLLNVYYRRAIVNYSLQDLKAALADVTYVIDKNPTDVKAYKLRAEIYGKLGNSAAAAVDESKAQDLSISNMLQQ